VRSLSPSGPDFRGGEKEELGGGQEFVRCSGASCLIAREETARSVGGFLKGNVISAGDVAAERVGTCNFKSKTPRGTAGQFCLLAATA